MSVSIKASLCKVCSRPAHFNESRFGYWVCKEHIGVPPAYVEQEKKDYEKNKRVDEVLDGLKRLLLE